MVSGKRGAGGVLAIGLAGASACTLINPAYDPDAGETRADGSASSSVEGGGTLEGGGTNEGGDSNEGGDTLEGGDTNEGGDTQGSSGGGQELCRTDEECSDDVFCNGIEACGPDKPDADASGCVFVGPACDEGLECVEDQQACLTDCDLDPDFDDDNVNAVNCGGADCDDAAPGITVPNSDWAHCGGCGMPCDSLEACVGGNCIDARRMFVSSVVFEGDVGGLAGADEACQDLADTAQLDGTFKAFIVDGMMGLDRFEPAGSVPYVRLDGFILANNWWQVADEAPLFFPIDRDEHRNLHDEDFTYAWTGITTNNTARDLDCSNWSTIEGAGFVGSVTSSAVAWKAANVERACNDPAHIYCIEQDPSFVPGG